MIFYFTATGNSLYVAKQLEDEIISIPQAIHAQNHHFAGDNIGIVCPVFGHEIPEMVKRFLKQSEFSTDYFYMVLTYGNRHGGAAELAHQLLRDLGIRVDYINVIKMVDNYLPAFDMDEQRNLDKKVDEQIAAIQSDIQSRRRTISEVTAKDREAHQEFLAWNAERPVSFFREMYRIMEQCNGCGICTRVCPAGCFEVQDGKAVQDSSNCQFCMACIHHCPQRAIQLNMPEKNPAARYRNEYIPLAEIIRSNEQKKDI